MSELILYGEFVDLRPLTVADAALTLQWRQSERAANMHRGATTVAEQAAWIAARPAAEFNFTICLKSGRQVGMLALCNIDLSHRHGESGRFLIGDDEAVRGVPVAVEAMKMLYELAFDHLKLVRVFGAVVSDNKLMVKWQKFMGMKEEGRMRNHCFINNRFQDAVIFGILEDEYRSLALPRMKAMMAAGRHAAAESH